MPFQLPFNDVFRRSLQILTRTQGGMFQFGSGPKYRDRVVKAKLDAFFLDMSGSKCYQWFDCVIRFSGIHPFG